MKNAALIAALALAASVSFGAKADGLDEYFVDENLIYEEDIFDVSRMINDVEAESVSLALEDMGEVDDINYVYVDGKKINIFDGKVSKDDRGVEEIAGE